MDLVREVNLQIRRNVHGRRELLPDTFSVDRFARAKTRAEKFRRETFRRNGLETQIGGKETGEKKPKTGFANVQPAA